jgi:thioredoxin-related protein
MKLRATFLAIALGLLLAGCRRNQPGLTNEGTGNESVHWLTDFAQAQAQARKQNKFLLMNFTGSDWCPPCIKLHREVFAQPEFADYAKQHLVLLEIDFPRRKEINAQQLAANQNLSNRFGVYWFPTIILLNHSGKVLGELGYVPGGPKPFLGRLEKLRNSR